MLHITGRDKGRFIQKGSEKLPKSGNNHETASTIKSKNQNQTSLFYGQIQYSITKGKKNLKHTEGGRRETKETEPKS
jgi:hypothetical protein